jgi:hypothetical protein
MATRARTTVQLDDSSRIDVGLIAPENRPTLGLVRVVLWPSVDVYLTEKAAGQLVDALVETLAALPEDGAS